MLLSFFPGRIKGFACFCLVVACWVCMKRSRIWLLLTGSLTVVLAAVNAAIPTLAFGPTNTPTPLAPGGHDGHHGGNSPAADNAITTPTPGETEDGLGMSSMDHLATPMMQMEGMDLMGGSDDHMGPIPSAGVPAATQDIGGQPLDFRVENGVKVFELAAQAVRWNILDDVTVTAWTYNGTVPGPMIRVTEGDRVRIEFTNQLPEPTTIHWHGMEVPNAMDGVPGATQDPVMPGERFTY